MSAGPKAAAEEEAKIDAVDTAAEVETPEHIRFRYDVAGPARRFFAYFLDLLLRGAIIAVLGVVLMLAGFAAGDTLGNASIGVLLVIVFLAEWLYYVICEMIWSGRTPGKMALQLRVVSERGHPLSFWQSFLRNLARGADALPNLYAVGVLVMGQDPRFRRLGDMLAGTMVVVEKRHVVDGPLRIEPPPSAEELTSLPQRLPIEGDELEAIELLLRREHRLAPARAYELASMVAPIYGARLGLKVHDPVRFLKVLYARARGGVGDMTVGQNAGHNYPGPPPPPPGGGYRQPPNYGAPGYGPPGYPPGYGPPGYGPPGYGPPGYGPPGYGPHQGPGGYGPPGYGPSAGWGQPPGYGGPQGYGPPHGGYHGARGQHR